jgi:hypothetical protein
MTEAMVESIEAESPEYDGREGAESYGSESEGESYTESSRDRDRDRRERARRLALARQRFQARQRGAGSQPAPQPTQAQAAINAVRNLDLETKVEEDAARRAIRSQRARMSRSEYAAVASVATNQFIESFDAPDNPFFRAALRFAPLLLLAPQPRGTGLERFIKDPRVVGGIAIGGIVLIAENRKQFTAVRQIDILGPSAIKIGDPDDQFAADVRDARGTTLNIAPIWSSSDTTRAEIDPNTGSIHAKVAGPVVITARVDGDVRRVRVQVNP